MTPTRAAVAAGVVIAGGVVAVAGLLAAIAGSTPPSPTPGGTPVAVGTVDGIPDVALTAYQHAEQVTAAAGCRVGWWILAGIGQIESGHGAGRLTASGDTSPPILGPRLDGTDGYAAIPDSDNGQWDNDPIWDRAVGPMQFLPSTWQTTGRDGNGDDLADPNNLYDAAAGAAAYLCVGRTDLDDPGQRRAALYSYNHSTSYVAAVEAQADHYRAAAALTPSTTSRPNAADTPADDPARPPG